jgi:hypothetical protein
MAFGPPGRLIQMDELTEAVLAEITQRIVAVSDPQ